MRTSQQKSTILLARYFGILAQGQTYFNVLYLLLAFPLGLAYFIFSVIGIALGIPLTILLVGFFILVLVGVGWWVFASFERLLAIWLLRIDIPPMAKPEPRPEGVWENLSSLLTNPVTWKSLFYLVLKPVLGVIALVALVALGGVSLALLLSPLTFWWNPVLVEWNRQITWAIDTALEAGIAFLAGIIIAVASLHVLNYMAYLYGLLARAMLGSQSHIQLPFGVPASVEGRAFSATGGETTKLTGERSPPELGRSDP